MPFCLIHDKSSTDSHPCVYCELATIRKKNEELVELLQQANEDCHFKDGGISFLKEENAALREKCAKMEKVVMAACMTSIDHGFYHAPDNCGCWLCSSLREYQCKGGA